MPVGVCALKRVLPVLVAAILLAGCGAQTASNGPNLEDRLRSIEAQQQTILKEIETVQNKQKDLESKLKDMERKIRNLEAEQRSLKMEQETLRSELRRLKLWDSDFDLPDVGGTTPSPAAKAANCKDPMVALSEALEKSDFLPSPTMLQTMADIAFREYEACMKAAGR